MFDFMPEQASAVAPSVDWLNSLVTYISVFFTLAITGAAVYFAVRYGRKGGVDHETPRIEGNNMLEVAWTVIPTLVSIYIAYWGISIYQDMRVEQPNALPINVYGQKWKWDFEYANGKTTNDELVVPVNRQIKLITKSRDVVHSFFIPAMRVKRDVLPSEYGGMYFTPTKTGTFNVFCTEYCGKDHWNMLATLRVVPEAEYERWINDKSDQEMMGVMDPKEVGSKLYTEKGCNACHSLNGTKLVGPSFLKLFGREGALEDGASYTADENYLYESIMEPQKKIVKGFAPLMPSFQGQLEEKQVNALITFIRSLDGTSGQQKEEAAEQSQPDMSSMSPAERGQAIFTAKACNACHSLDGSKLIGPSFKGVFGRKEKLADGSEIIVDAEYIKQSILEPGSQVVEGFTPSMPTYKGQLDDSQLNDIVEWMKTLK